MSLVWRAKVAGILMAGMVGLKVGGAPAGEASGGATRLMSGLGCIHCHTELGEPGDLRDRTPDLSSAGLRYQPAYLFEYLQKPERVRRHLGHAWMPGYHFSPEEALALVAFLETQQQVGGHWPAWPAEIQAQLQAPPQRVMPGEFQTLVNSSLICLSCHTMQGRGGSLGVELGNVGYRLRPHWIRTYLVAPAMFGVPADTMPPQFYQPAPDGSRFEEIAPQAAHKIQVVTDHLASLNSQKRLELEARYGDAKRAFPRASAALGEQIFASQNCAACHRHERIPPRLQQAVPDLTGLGARVSQAWLQRYLERPMAVRPFGYRPGDGGRMPDFGLSKEEAEVISGFLMQQRQGEPPLTGRFEPRPLSAFLMAKARRLLEDKLSCLGCHRLGEVGGRVGPDLTTARDRLQVDYLFAVVEDPGRVASHGIMPQSPLSSSTLNLIVNYLLQQDEPAPPPTYLSLTDYPLLPLTFEAGLPAAAPVGQAASLYLSHCAPCHGAEGGGNGFNASFLPVAPTRHAEASHMTRRPDDTLYDGTAAGGMILNKSPRMPAWGGGFSPEEIRGLVSWMRKLCQCDGPHWSRDDAPPEAGTTGMETSRGATSSQDSTP